MSALNRTDEQGNGLLDILNVEKCAAITDTNGDDATTEDIIDNLDDGKINWNDLPLEVKVDTLYIKLRQLEGELDDIDYTVEDSVKGHLSALGFGNCIYE